MAEDDIALAACFEGKEVEAVSRLARVDKDGLAASIAQIDPLGSGAHAGDRCGV